MKNIALLFILIIGYLYFIVSTAETRLTYPEKGITCIDVKNWRGSIVHAGCYTGDVTKSDNQLNEKATLKYQGIRF